MKNFFASRSVNGGHVKVHFDHLTSGIRFDLEREKFFHMPLSHANRYNLIEPFGPDAAKAFPAAVSDSQEAGNCFAFVRYTASIYHLMRVLEHGLNAFLNEFPALRPKNPNWGTILSEIETAVTVLPKTNPKKKSYLSLITDFKIFKDAWRNDVSHVGSKYLEDDADSIYRHVGQIYENLATNGYHE